MSKLLSNQEMITAVLSNDARYDGQFYFGVLSTKIFCIPSCKSKIPLEKNLIFFKTQEEALTTGYRGCKRCNSEFFPNTTPLWFKNLISQLNNELHVKMDENDLSRLTGVDISTIRRSFKSKLGVSPISYHRKLRLKNAFKMLKEGENIDITAKKCSFKSRSGFSNAFIKAYGLPPRTYLKSISIQNLDMKG